MKKHTLLLLAVAAAFAACTALPIEAREVEFAWDPNPETDVNEYRIEVRDATTNALLKSVVVTAPTVGGLVPTTVAIGGYPVQPTKVTAFAIARQGEVFFESLPSDILPIEAFKPGQVKNVRKK